ncbi:MAG TPA: serine protein kinase RIO [archaeon]|nr:serine protein kinase RIO [archaeon]HLD80413.1 serine protein kinase RIO [archaeon]
MAKERLGREREGALERAEKLDALRLFKSKRVKDPEKDRAIRSEVFDEHTVNAVDALIRKKVIDCLSGVIATGKEANVFLAFTLGSEPVAVKIYKLETSSFHSMSKYILGDPRFENIKRDRRSIVFNWCKKEFRNLQKATDAGVRVPMPLAFKDNVLVMEFIGSYDAKTDKATPAWPLKNTPIPKGQEQVVFEKVVEFIARLFYKAQLVHGDLSEYNVLVRIDSKGKLEPVLIDIGQGVLTSHPLAQELIDRDIEKTAGFFSKIVKGVTPESVREKVRAWESRL